ncbi:DUF305 domain-containing protein [Streptomyces sp. NPDC046887]|uniref:DUF305 domain-containing protein n=1 Tax=Streptomyces sp. NPDC046887 TaxID=3155472 RepID=UPI0033EFD566
MSRTNWAAVTAVVLALLFAGTAAVASAGGDDTPAEARVPAADSADAGFARDMSVHHQQAVEMSFIVRDRTEDEEVRRLAYDIANTQANQRGMMLGWLDRWGLPKVASGTEPMAWMRGAEGHEGHESHGGHGGHGGQGADGAHGGHGGGAGADGALMPGMATEAQLDSLRKASGKEAEVLYLRLMTAHHQGGVEMAEGCVTECRDEVELRLAQGMVDAQQSEIALMADMLRERGASAH